MKKDAQRDAKNALVNLFVFPGLGSLRSGRWVAGVGQILFSVVGCAMVLVWFFKEVSQYYDLMFDVVKPQSVGWIGVVGGVLLVVAWAWAGLTSVSLFRAASKTNPVPPVLYSVADLEPADANTQNALAALPNWQRHGQIISRTYEFEDFPAAMKFVNAVAELAEQAKHHPDIDVRWNQVTLALTTHDAGGLTDKDFALAHACDAQCNNA